MKFAKWVFAVAGVWGILILTPMYFMFDKISADSPPVITHAEYYFGFLGVAWAFQIVFLIIAKDPVRFRPMMIPSLIEKWGYLVSLAVLFGQTRITYLQLLTAGPDALLGVLFVIAFFKTRTAGSIHAAA